MQKTKSQEREKAPAATKHAEANSVGTDKSLTGEEAAFQDVEMSRGLYKLTFITALELLETRNSFNILMLNCRVQRRIRNILDIDTVPKSYLKFTNRHAQKICYKVNSNEWGKEDLLERLLAETSLMMKGR